MIRTNQDLLQFIIQQEGIQQQTLKPGQKLLHQDGKPLHAYIIRQGIAKCYITEENGKDYILEFFGEGEVLGELELLQNTTILSTVEAVTELMLYKISGSSFWQLLETNPHFNRIILKELATRVSQLAIRVSYQQLYPIEYTVLKLLSLFSHQELTLSKQDLADYLAISLRSLNRTLKQLREKCFIPDDSLHLHLSQPELDKLLKRFDEL
ncbi:Crp/Fnr family transcriptional regulator [Paraflavitalea speifideaquila]|uniref:Crp/Fnr family transcriptional regulator n=1 Tax=Paraflavitalea speifideaquila TaxID=3076558 RepID=UPI0028E6585F|nr:Crp/Fnr family transcriptional regulator [Paraflavitalea speifideiaquila]